MRLLTIIVLSVATLAAARQAARAPARELDNVAAFARLYGVLRYFFPSDAAANLDWDDFAIEGVTQVRAAGSAKALEALVAPLGPGIEIGEKLAPRPAAATLGEKLVAWRYFGPGFGGSTVPGPCRVRRSRPIGIDRLDAGRDLEAGADNTARRRGRAGATLCSPRCTVRNSRGLRAVRGRRAVSPRTRGCGGGRRTDSANPAGPDSYRGVFRQQDRGHSAQCERRRK